MVGETGERVGAYARGGRDRPGKVEREIGAVRSEIDLVVLNKQIDHFALRRCSSWLILLTGDGFGRECLKESRFD